MAKVSGIDVLIYADVAGTQTILGGQSGATLNREASVIETTSKDGGGWQENLTNILSWSIEAEGYVVVDDEAFAELETKFEGREAVTIELRLPNGEMYTGDAYISEFPLEAGLDDAMTYSLTFTGSGALSKGTVVTP